MCEQKMKRGIKVQGSQGTWKVGGKGWKVMNNEWVEEVTKPWGKG